MHALAEHLAVLLRAEGMALEVLAHPQDRADWRQAARRAGRLLGQRVETCERGERAYVAVRSEDRTEQQRTFASSAMREASAIVWQEVQGAAGHGGSGAPRSPQAS